MLNPVTHSNSLPCTSTQTGWVGTRGWVLILPEDRTNKRTGKRQGQGDAEGGRTWRRRGSQSLPLYLSSLAKSALSTKTIL